MFFGLKPRSMVIALPKPRNETKAAVTVTQQSATERAGTGEYLGHQQIAPLSLQMAVVTLTLIPIILAYPFVQKHLTKGVLLGAIKG